MTERRRGPRFTTRTMRATQTTSEHLVSHGHPRIVIGRTELLTRTALRPEQLTRIERNNLVRPLGESARETYYPREALAQVERVQTLIAAGYAERDVAHVVGRVAAVTGSLIDRVVELDPASASALSEDRLIPIWAVTEAGQPLIHVLDQPLCEALMALRTLGLGALAAPLSGAVAETDPSALAELRRTIERHLDTLDEASILLRKRLTKLAPSRGSRAQGLRRLLRRRK